MHRLLAILFLLPTFTGCGDQSQEPAPAVHTESSPADEATESGSARPALPETSAATPSPEPAAEVLEQVEVEPEPAREEAPPEDEEVAAERVEEPTPTPEPAPSLAAPTLGSHEDLSLRRLVIATDIEEREPVGAAQRFSSNNEQITVFLGLRNEGAEAVSVRVVFERPNGSRMNGLSLEVPAGATRWRTWARSRNIHTPGVWSAVVETGAGVEIGRSPFEITPGTGDSA